MSTLHLFPRFSFMCPTNSSSRYGHAAISSKFEKSGLMVCEKETWTLDCIIRPHLIASSGPKVTPNAQSLLLTNDVQRTLSPAPPSH